VADDEQTTPQKSGGAAGTEKTCPNCGAAVSATAVTCRACRRDLANPEAPPLVLSEDAWDTEVPDWMVENEQRAAARRQAVSRLSEMQWSLLCLGTTTLIGFLTWRLAVMPPPPMPPKPKTEPVRVATTQHFPVINATETPEPTPTPEALPSVTVVLPTPFPEPANVPTPDPTPPPIDRLPGIQVSATDLVSEYQNNRLAAGQRYGDNLLSITGIVKATGVNASKIPYVVLDGDSSDVNVKCFFDGPQKLDRKKVEVGTSVVIRGICNGAFVDINLSECDLR
jgi:hypothetical protein